MWTNKLFGAVNFGGGVKRKQSSSGSGGADGTGGISVKLFILRVCAGRGSWNGCRKFPDGGGTNGRAGGGTDGGRCEKN